MRTMANVWFFVIVLVSVQKVFGNVCMKDDNQFSSCDECIRCGGEWCNNVGATHCSFMQTDDFCPDNREYTVMVKEDPDKPGINVNPVYAERNLVLKNHGPEKIDIRYSAKSKQKTPTLAIVDTTQTFNIDLKQSDPVCSGSTCVFTIEATPTSRFCNATGGPTESLEVKVNVGLEEEVRIKYFVACACGCSQKVERNSKVCNGNGNFSCGVCTCDPGWEGLYCSEKKIEKIDCGVKRGDIYQCSLNPKKPAECFYNGECGPCETCVCFTDREGSQYFDQENNCAGLCNVITSDCEDCLFNTSLGHCSKCEHSLTMERYNVSLTNETDDQNRKIWVRCNETIDDCGELQFFAKRDRSGISVMMVNHCNEIIAGAIVADTKVPIILGVLAVLAVVAAVGGVMLWKHMNTVPPVPLNDPQYQNIDAEDCTGENPLYKPPTSSFKNPTYGKW